MAVVVEQTVPFSSSALNLESPHRWNDIFPLIRPSVRQVQTAKGQHILVDQALAKSNYINVVAVGNLGNFSSKLLDDNHITAIVTEQTGAGVLTPQDVQHALRSVGAAEKQGIVVVRSGKTRKVKIHGSDIVEVEVAGELESDHVIHLLGHATNSCRTSIHQTTELLKLWSKGASTAHSKFHTQKANGGPAIRHASGDTVAYEKVKHAVERDLKHVMSGQTAQSAEATYTVHYSDINGLSRLENYILAKEIAEYLGMFEIPTLCFISVLISPDSQNAPYRLSHSTVLDHQEGDRGFAISICAVPSSYLNAQAKAKKHTRTSTSDANTLPKVMSPSQAKLQFSDREIRKRVEAGCYAVIKKEPTITEYDTIVGDGDCGYTLRDGAKQVLSFIEGKDLTRLPETVAALVHDLEVNMGGTSGALYCIFLTALAASLASEDSFPKALKGALDQLLQYTRARVGDRTMMDTLIPFVDVLSGSGDVHEALSQAKTGMEGTKKMEAKLGRSSYLDESATQGVPDPGAYGLWIILQGMAEV